MSDYVDFHRRFVAALKARQVAPDLIADIQRIMLDGEKRYGDCAFARNEVVFGAADFRTLARAAHLKMLAYIALGDLQDDAQSELC